MGLTAENSNAIALGLIGDEWNLAITRLAIMTGVRRYKDFRDQLGIANSVLTARLRRLTEAGVFTMAQYSDAPRRFEYVLTDRGRDLWKVLLTIWSWEAVWVTEHTEPLPPMYHLECGEEFTPVMGCRACGQPAGIRDVRGTFGPSGGFERSVPRATTRRRSAGGSPGPGLVPQTIELIGNRWSASALAAAFLGARRFTDMLVMTGAPPTIVSDRLRTFCQMGVLKTVAAKAGSARVEYRLTDKGRAFATARPRSSPSSPCPRDRRATPRCQPAWRAARTARCTSGSCSAASTVRATLASGGSCPGTRPRSGPPA